MGDDGNVLVELLGVASLKGVGIPVVASSADADDSTLAVVSGIFPGNDSPIATYSENGCTGAGFPCLMVVVTAPISSDVILCCGVGDMLSGIWGIYCILVVAFHELMP